MSPPSPDHYDAVVVGAGFGGLGAALTLAEGGARVLLLEALNYPGGCASTFSRGGYRFEAGATLFSGFGDGQLMSKWIERHGIDVTVDWPDPMIELRTPHWSLPISNKREALVEAFAAMPDAPVEALRRFFARQERIADTLWELFDDPALLPPVSAGALLRHLARTPKYLPLLPLMGKPLFEVLERAKLADFEPLRVYFDALCQITVQTSVREAETPFALAATDYAFRGTGHVHGGIGELAWGLTKAIERCGGEVRMGCRVRSLERCDEGWRVRGKRVDAVAPRVVGNVLPQALCRMVDESATLEESTAKATAAVETGWGAVMLYLGVDGAADIRHDAHHLEMVADVDAPFVEGNHVFCSLSDVREQGRAPSGQRTATLSTHVPMTKLLALDDAQQADYIAAIQRDMWRTVERLAPEVSTATRHRISASPRTFERFTGRPQGYVGGIPRRAGLHNYRNMFPAALERGLFMVGDTAFPGQSTLATAIGGARVAEVILRS